MKIAKKLYIVVLSAAMVLSVGSLTVYANNYTDTAFDFTFPPQSYNSQYTNARTKTDSTSSYMKLRNLSQSNVAFYAEVVHFDYSSFSKTWVYKFDSGDLHRGRYLLNYAFEDYGHTRVRIEADRAVSPNLGFTADGVWSPDSI
ncbi:hypothetical protein GCM10009001_27290 [Virgibacillus siamensis]|uniref:Uncharacterized protein n=1 Tax=Virgibacillus siamensis TaxID=480071 RepID=A0ABN1GCA0_9BACI